MRRKKREKEMIERIMRRNRTETVFKRRMIRRISPSPNKNRATN